MQYKINKTYDEYMKKACKDHPLRGLLAVGLKLMELVGYRYSTAYDRRIGGLMAQIYGIEEADIQLRLLGFQGYVPAADKLLQVFLRCWPDWTPDC